MIKILIVEDDKNISKMIQAAISIVGYESDTCYNGKEAVLRIVEGSYDLILLDIMLPEMDGFKVIEKIKFLNIPVIFLSALQDVSDKVRGLKLGAEDYIVKPFEAVELLARIEVVLRRTNKAVNTMEYGDIKIDIDKHMVYKAEKPVELTPKEFSLLVFFIENVDVLITRERLLAAVWGYLYEGESRTVEIHVQKVRRKLGLQDTLITIPKLGYRLNKINSQEKQL